MGEITPPQPLTASHDCANFDCGVESLNLWLRKHALKNEATGASRTFVVCRGKKVVGYYALATGSIAHRQAAGRVRRKMPDPIPVMILGRLAVDRHWHCRGLGRGLLKDALLRTLAVSGQAGIRALLVHALSEAAKAFYLRHGFLASPSESFALMLPLEEARRKGLSAECRVPSAED